MIRHVVMFRFRNDADATQRRAVRDAIATMPGATGATEAYAIGPDLGLAEGNFDFAVVGDFADEAAYLTYRDHPEHQRIVSEIIRPAISDRAAIQYEIPQPPKPD
ncbi:Dabb family protein [Candidatus Poriferisocius sp.]|uniref:Dabb family protein n=1 Tax=Candidatus Poriferisocius sp. TaxID=3101276 RepID=UPI003B010FC2